ncbi:uncharacterized protein isoform X1 [Musca autumnalis]|uniref:uncharacterized protein isoform X1 n=1 Tax=Musca autumnalis TaxID=221902 RepID=UPI003CE9F4A3
MTENPKFPQYAILKITQKRKQFIVSNGANNKLIPTEEEFFEFLKQTASQVVELSANIPLSLEIFGNLTKFKYHADNVTTGDLKKIADAVPYLEELDVSAYEFETDANLCVKSETIEQLLRFVKLKSLRLDMHDFGHRINFKDFHKVVTQLPVEMLDLSFSILLEAGDNVEEIKERNTYLPLSKLSINSTENHCQTFKLLNTFKNLQKLNISFVGEEQVTEDELKEFFQCFENVTHLKMSYTKFKEIHNFAVPPNVTTLHLSYCDGLTFENLQQLLEETPQLIEFESEGMSYNIGEDQVLKISPLIESLSIENVDKNLLRVSTTNKPTALRNVKLHLINPYKSIFSRPHISAGPTPAKPLTLDHLLQFKNLKKFSFAVNLPDQWSYVIGALQQLPLLCELTVRVMGAHRGTTASLLPQAFATNITQLNVYYHCTPEWCLNFWLDMFTQNPEMNLNMNIFLHNEAMLQNFIELEKFPQNLKTVMISGFNVDCAQLRNNFEETLKTFKYNFEEFEVDDLDRLDYNIVLSRK